MYDQLMNYEQMLHERNQRRIRNGLRCIYIIPAIFLFLLFATGSSKIIFLVLWIVSLFGIAVYLILIEYNDYNLQQKMNEIKGCGEKEPDSLIALNEVEEKMVSAVVERIGAKGGKDE